VGLFKKTERIEDLGRDVWLKGIFKND